MRATIWTSHGERTDAVISDSRHEDVCRCSSDAKKWLATAVALACAGSIHVAAAITLAGVALPPNLSVGGRRLALLSCGVRDTLWIDHYVAALYVPRGAAIEAVRDPLRAKAVLIHMVETRYLPEHIPDKWLEALEREVPPRSLSRVRKAYRRLADGDEMIIYYLPQRGVTMLVNGRTLARLGGQAVIDAILDAWAENEPVDSKLKGLLADHTC